MANLSEFGGHHTSSRKFFVIRRPIWPHVFIALFGAGWGVSFGVRVYGAEIVTMLGLLLLPWTSLPNRYPMLKKILAALALWVVAIGLSDVVNSTPLFDSLRHMATPIIGAASLVFAVSVLSRKPSALLTFLTATAIAKAMLGDAAYGDTFADETLDWATIEANTNIFKVRIVPFLTPALLVLACWLGRRNLRRTSIIFLLASIGYFAMDTRAEGLILFLSAMVLTIINTGFRSRWGHIILVSIIAAVASYVGYVSYVDYTIAFNPNGHNGQQLLMLENPYNPFRLLMQGRSEWLVWPAAFTERPFFGWGSWAEDKDGHFTLLRFALLEGGISAPGDFNAQGNYIPVHSLFGAAFIWSGLLGLIAILWFLHSILSMGRSLMLSKSYLLPVVTFLLFQLLWHFFFSPPQHVRLTFPIGLASLIVLTSAATDRARRSVKAFNDYSQ
jgi:hypothetical protein